MEIFKPNKNKIMITFVILVVYEIIIFIQGYNFGSRFDCGLNQICKSSIEYGFEYVKNSVFNINIIPTIIISYLISCAIFSIVKKK